MKPRVHELKCDPQPYEDIEAGRKRAEVRADDREFAIGDVLRLRETVYTGAQMHAGYDLAYTGRELAKKITHIQRGYGLPDGVAVLSFDDPPVEFPNKRLAPLPVPTDIMEARAQGRAEALAIILNLNAEEGLDDYTGSHPIGDTGEYGSHWDEDALRKLLRADDEAWSLMQEAEGEYWHNLGLREEAEHLYANALKASGAQLLAAAEEALAVIPKIKPQGHGNGTEARLRAAIEAARRAE